MEVQHALHSCAVGQVVNVSKQLPDAGQTRESMREKTTCAMYIKLFMFFSSFLMPSTESESSSACYRPQMLLLSSYLFL